MPKQTLPSHPKDKQPALSVSEYLWLQGEKSRLEFLDSQLTKMQYRQDKQASWLMMLILMVILMVICLVIIAVS